jgi:glutaredoxin
MYSLKALVLEGCPYSKQLKDLLKEYNIKTEYINISWNDKDKYKTKEISTFPQVYMIDNNSKSILIGGYSDVKNIIDIIKNNNYDNVKKKLSKYQSLPNKTFLRLIEIFTKTG